MLTIKFKVLNHDNVSISPICEAATSLYTSPVCLDYFSLCHSFQIRTYIGTFAKSIGFGDDEDEE